MAKDKMVYTIRNISSSCLVNIKEWNQVYKPGKTKKETSSKSRSNVGNPFYSMGIFRKTEGLVDLQFMQYSRIKGDLKLSVNIPNIYHGNPTTPKSRIPVEELEDIIHKEIKEVCQTSLLPAFSDWSVTKDETNIDIIGKSLDIDALFEVLLKTKVPRYKLDDTYAKRGTIYFYTGEKLAGSNSVISIYYKDRELAAKNEIFNDNGYALQPDEHCLRLEIRNSKGPLKTAYKKTQERFNDIQIQSLSDTVVSDEFQINTLEDLVNVFKLDRVFLPQDELIEVIDKSILSKKSKSTMKRYIEYENGVGEISKSSYYRYRNTLQVMGYSPIYSSKKLYLNLSNIGEYVELEKSFYWTNVP